MNRILFEPSEIVRSADGAHVCVTFGGVRAEHVRTVLHGEVGQTLKTGELDGPVGTGVITGLSPSGDVAVTCVHAASAPEPWCDLVLAPPRPRVLKRLLPQLASLGVGTVVLVGAKKVEKDFWGATLLRPENYRPLLVEGLMQAGTTRVPVLELRRNFRRFVADELDALFPTANRLVAHPYGASAAAPLSAGRPLLAVGPEGGWTDDEVALLEAHGFVRRSLGPRILRTDTALVALLARMMPI